MDIYDRTILFHVWTTVWIHPLSSQFRHPRTEQNRTVVFTLLHVCCPSEATALSNNDVSNWSIALLISYFSLFG